MGRIWEAGNDMRLRKQLDAEQATEGTGRRREGRGWGPFTGGQLTLIIGMLAVVVAFPMVASAVIPNGNTYNACALKTTGALRVIDTSKHQTCKTAETKLSWSKTGAKGATGSTGAPGSARAYAYVNADGTVNAARSKNITVSTISSPPVLPIAYCIMVTGGIDPTTVAPDVTVADPPGTATPTGNKGGFELPAGLSLCPAGTAFVVGIANPGGTLVASDFTVLVP